MFIKLTLMNDEPVRINFDHIESYGIITKTTNQAHQKYIGYTYLLPVGMKEEDCYVVKEAPQEIDVLLYPNYKEIIK